MDRTPFMRLAELEIEPSALAKYRRLLAEAIAMALAREPGVIALDAVALADAPERIRILEIYADRQAYEAHLTTPHFLAYKAATADMVRSLALHDVLPVTPVRMTAEASGAGKAGGHELG